MTHTKLQGVIVYLVAIMTSCILFFLIYPHTNLTVPLNYQYDVLFTSMSIKSVLDNGWYIFNSFLGAPGIQNTADYPLSDTANFLIIKLLALFFNHYAAVLNSFYFLTFPLAAITSLFVFRKVGLSRIAALVASLLYAFTPYHFFRGEAHLFLSAYYVVPLYIYLMVTVYTHRASENTLSYNALSIFICVWAASSGIYYAFFGAYFILLTGMMTALETKEWRHLIKSSLFVVVITATLGLNILPSLVKRIDAGPNLVVTYRSPVDAEVYGFKIIQLVSPIDQHRLPGWRKSKDHYNGVSPLINENSMAALGVIASLGFFALLFILLMRTEAVQISLAFMSRLNIYAVLLGTIGGLGAIFAYHISPMIRAYNRISVFIVFFSLSAFFIILQKLLKPLRNKYSRGFVLIGILIIGLFDQIPLLEHVDVNKTFQSDAKFIAKIEAAIPPGSCIFQLPFMAFPEAPDHYKMKDYDPYRAYLHSKKLKWSYGAVTGRTAAAWQNYVTQKPVAEMVDDLVFAQFSGIYLDRNGYPNNAVEIEKKLQSVLGIKPLVSDDQRFAFYDLRNYAKLLQQKMPMFLWDQKIKQVSDLFAHSTVGDTKKIISYIWISRFTHPIGKQNAVLEISNKMPYPVMVTLYLRLNKQKNLVSVSGDLVNELIPVVGNHQILIKQIMLFPGKHVMRFQINNQATATFVMDRFDIKLIVG
jgi:hypothetical protein